LGATSATEEAADVRAEDIAWEGAARLFAEPGRGELPPVA
jgi:hypothetical protein